MNELLTNSLKYAFPPAGTGFTDRGEPSTIGVRMTRENGGYILKVFDNGIGFPAGFDPLAAKTLGLKLVTFLAKHQMQAEIAINMEKGTEFTFRFGKGTGGSDPGTG